MNRKEEVKADDYSIVSYRNEFFSVQDEVEQKLGTLNRSRPIDLTNDAVYESFEGFLLDFALTILRRAHWAFKRAAERGMEEAERLVQDPNYYETLRARRQRQRQSSINRAAEYKREEQRRLAERPPDVLQEEIDQIDHQISNYESGIERLKHHREDLVTLLKLKQSNRQFRVVETISPKDGETP